MNVGKWIPETICQNKHLQDRIFTVRSSGCGKVMFSHACVIPLYTGGGVSFPACITGQMTGGLHPGGTSTSRGTGSREGVGQTPPPHEILLVTVNTRTLRILLEYILVLN